MTLASHPHWLWAPYPHVPLLCRSLTTLSSVLGGGTLRTCVLRPPGIYGPDEQRHLPRVAVGPPSLPGTSGRSPADVVCMLSWSLSRGSVPSQRLSMLGGLPDAHQPRVPHAYHSQSFQRARKASVQVREKESYDPRKIAIWEPQGVGSSSQAASEGLSYQKTLEKSGY